MPQDYDRQDAAAPAFQMPPDRGRGAKARKQAVEAARAGASGPISISRAADGSDPAVVVPQPLYCASSLENASVAGSSFVADGASAASVSESAPYDANGAGAASVAAPAAPPVSAPGAACASAPLVTVAPAPRGHGWIVGIVVALCLLAFSLFSVYSCTNLFQSFGASAAPAALPDNSIAVIDLEGTIQYDGSAASPEGLGTLLDQAKEEDAIKAVVLRVNSGGGTAAAGEEMAQLVRDFPKPVVVSSAATNASAAYEVSSQADYIFVAKATEIGAIGTAIEVEDMSEMLERLGIKVDVITSADSKDSSYGFRPLTEGERAYYQHIVDQINDTFVAFVAEGRSMTEDQVRELATGLVFTGIDAVGNGLADAVGTRQDALDKAAQLAGIDAYQECELALPGASLGGLGSILGSEAPAQNGGASDAPSQEPSGAAS